LDRATAEKELAEGASRTAADAETRAQDAAKNAAPAKERIARLNNGEALTGGLGTPRELTRQDLIKAGFTASNLQHCTNLNEHCNLLGDDVVQMAEQKIRRSKRSLGKGNRAKNAPQFSYFK